ncbi:MAG TPA: hypothetical protein VKX49_29295 [Bryobacteraceae bacterium]|nr:hypothetical protein [Bryobacteraceae bacterium]
MPPLLSLIREFNDFDKHRLLSLTMQHVMGGNFGFITPMIGKPTFHYLKTPIVNGVEFFYFTLTPPQPDVQYDCQASFAISVSHAQGPSGTHTSEILYFLDVLIKEVRQVVDFQIRV